MDPYNVYRYYLAIKLHFTSEHYDIFQYNGKTTTSRKAFDVRRDKFMFERISKKYKTDKEVVDFFVSNLVYGFIGVVYDTEANERYTEWVKHKESVSELFFNDLNKILDHLERHKLKESDMYTITNGVPVLLNLFLGGHISIHTLCLLNNLNSYLDDWNNNKSLLLFNDYFLRIRKVSKFITHNKDKIAKIYENFKVDLSLL